MGEKRYFFNQRFTGNTGKRLGKVWCTFRIVLTNKWVQLATIESFLQLKRSYIFKVNDSDKQVKQWEEGLRGYRHIRHGEQNVTSRT
jgi:hypothetical protein